MEHLMSISNKLINQVDFSFKRSLIDNIDWSQKLIEIRGSRGVGKTTLMLQKAKTLQEANLKTIYVSLDMPYFYSESLFDFADTFTKYGGKYLFLDEVHRYPSKHKNSDWSLELKNIADAFPELKIVYSGSSILHLFKGQGDLSRRKATFLLNGLSFREYLEMNKIAKFSAFAIKDILKSHENIAKDLIIKFKPIVHFKEYLKIGYFPFYNGNENIYFRQLTDVINTIIDTDLPYLSPITQAAKEQLKRLLGAISTSVPYTPSMSKLAALINVRDYRTLLKYLQLLHEAQIISLITSNSKGNKILQKPEKILINNTNLMLALGINNADLGTQRETFFYNQTSHAHKVNYSNKTDFIINDKYLFEIGGKSKNNKQISGSNDAFIVADDIELGFGNKIPLWLFGFLY